MRTHSPPNRLDKIRLYSEVYLRDRALIMKRKLPVMAAVPASDLIWLIEQAEENEELRLEAERARKTVNAYGARWIKNLKKGRK